MRRDRVYTAEEFLRTLSGCREKAQQQYTVERKKIDADGIIAAVRNGDLHRLTHMPSDVRLSLLMELMSEVKKNGSKWSIPLSLFRDVDLAAGALLHLEP